MLLKRLESKSFHSTDSKNESIHNNNNSGRDAYQKLEKKKRTCSSMVSYGLVVYVMQKKRVQVKAKVCSSRSKN